MMTRAAIACAAILTVLSLCPAAATTDTSEKPPQDEPRDKRHDTLKVGFGLTLLVPSGDSDREWDLGWSGSARICFALNPAIGLGIGAEYNRYEIEPAARTSSGVGLVYDGGSRSLFYVPIEVQIHRPGPTNDVPSPYLLLGAGYFREDIADASVAVEGEEIELAGSTEEAAGFHFGAGVAARRWFVEGLAVWGLGDAAGIGHWTLRAGVIVDGTSVGR